MFYLHLVLTMIMLINIIFTIKDTKLYVPVVTLSVKDTQKLLKLLSKGFERSVYWNEFKRKSENKNTTNGYRYFDENQDANSKRFKARRYYLPKGTINNYNIIINGKHFHDKAMD